jgi:hypothetical protein
MKIEIVNTPPKKIIDSLERFIQSNNIPIRFKCESETQEIFSFSGGANEIEVKGPYQYFKETLDDVFERKKKVENNKKSFTNIFETLFSRKSKDAHVDDLKKISESIETIPKMETPIETQEIPDTTPEKIKKIKSLRVLFKTNDNEIDENILKNTKIYYMLKRDGLSTRFI